MCRVDAIDQYVVKDSSRPAGADHDQAIVLVLQFAARDVVNVEVLEIEMMER